MNNLIRDYVIQSVFEVKYLYDKSNSKYKDPIAKKQAYADIAENIQYAFSVPFTGDDVEKLWLNMVDEFKNYHENEKEKNRSGSAATEETVADDFYKNLSFLKNHLEHRSSLSSFSSPPSIQSSTHQTPSLWQLPAGLSLGEKSQKEGVSTKPIMPSVDQFAINRERNKEKVIDHLELLRKSIENQGNELTKSLQEEKVELSPEEKKVENHINVLLEELEKLPASEQLECYTDLLQDIIEFKLTYIES